MTLTIPKGSKDVGQLHGELLTAFPTWKGTWHPDGYWINPLVRVESTETEIWLNVPDGTNPQAVLAVVTAHVPRPPKDWKAIRRVALGKLKATLGLDEDELSALGFGK